MKTKAAFLGLGVMGRPIAKNLLGGGVELAVYNRTAGRSDELTALGAVEVPTPQAAAGGVQFVFTCLGDGTSVEQNLFGPNGAAASLAPGAIVVDFTTIAPIEAEGIAARLKESGVHYLDAPVSGGDIGARNGTLTIMVGGEPGAFTRTLPLLSLVGKKIEHIGPAGFGQRMKAANQVAVALNNIGLTEALSFAVNSGLDPEQTLRILGSGAAGSWALSNYGPRLFNGEFGPGFFAAHMLKDLRIAETEARRSGVELPGVVLMIRMYEQLCGLKVKCEGPAEFKSGAELGSHALIKLYQDRFGTKELP